MIRVCPTVLIICWCLLLLWGAGPAGAVQFFPQEGVKLMPYFEKVFRRGHECAQPSSLVTSDSISQSAEKLEKAAASVGLAYDWVMSFDYTGVATRGVSGTKQGLVAFNTEFWGTWNLVQTDSRRYGLFLLLETAWGPGLNYSQDKAGAQRSVGSLSDPQGSYRAGSGFCLPNLSLGISLFGGKWVGSFGSIDTTNLLDLNAYSSHWAGGFMNKSFNYNPGMPHTRGNWGYTTAMQLSPRSYSLYSTTGCNTALNQNPFTRINGGYWVHLGEYGFVFEDVFGLGPGTYRLQYAITQYDDLFGTGGAFNFEQKLGKNNPLGFFTRCALMSEKSALMTGVKRCVTAGLVMQAPFRERGWGSEANNDRVGLGFMWLRATETQGPYSARDEYGVELNAVVQITPTFFVQPDVQYLINPVRGRGNGQEVILQFQTVWKF